MPETAFTIHDTPGLVRRIQGDLDVITASVRRADPHLRSLLLTGGFARGEGAAFRGAPQNDYDLVAVRRMGRPRVPYERVRADLERRLGLHIDLAPVGAWRLPFVSRSIFWYETAQRSRVLWGADVRRRIRIQDAKDIRPQEGLRLLVNRAAGLLLVTESHDAHARRLQAAKGILAALDAQLLATGHFAPSQRERWQIFEDMRLRGQAPEGLEAVQDWLEWAYTFKVAPDEAAPKDAGDAWREASKILLDAVPVALTHARLSSLDEYARRDGVLSHVFYLRRSADVPGARRLVLNPTGRVRVGTLRLLAASLDGRVDPDVAQRSFERLVTLRDDPLKRLEALRHATLQ